MPRIELFRWIFAFALIAATLPLLLACGPGDEPTRERETREPARESRQTGTSAPRVLWERTPTPGSGISLIQQFRESTPTSTARPRSAAPTRAAPAPTRRVLVPTRDPTATPVPEGWVLTQSEAIHRATYSSYAADVEKLLDQGADTGAQASLRNGKLEVELRRTDLGRADAGRLCTWRRALIQTWKWPRCCWNGAPAAMTSRRTRIGWTALHFAAQFDLPEIAEVVLDQGADSKATNNNGQTPCQVARQLNSFTGTQLLGRLCRP